MNDTYARFKLVRLRFDVLAELKKTGHPMLSVSELIANLLNMEYKKYDKSIQTPSVKPKRRVANK
jgi:hypothetical protein